MTAAAISAFLLFLSAFGVDQPTIDSVRAVLQPAAASTLTATTTLQVNPDGSASVNVSSPQSTPQFGGTIQSVESKADITVEVIKRDANAARPFGSYSFKVRVLDQDGNYTQSAPVIFNGHTENANNISGQVTFGGPFVKDYYAEFSYTPTEANSSLTFTSGSLTKTIAVQ